MAMCSQHDKVKILFIYLLKDLFDRVSAFNQNLTCFKSLPRGILTGIMAHLPQHLSNGAPVLDEFTGQAAAGRFFVRAFYFVPVLRRYVAYQLAVEIRDILDHMDHGEFGVVERGQAHGVGESVVSVGGKVGSVQYFLYLDVCRFIVFSLS